MVAAAVEPGTRVRASVGASPAVEGVVRAGGQYMVAVEWIEITRDDGSVVRIEAIGATASEPHPDPIVCDVLPDDA